MLFQSDRTFKVWDYNVSHRQLLVRSPRTPEIDSNIDLVFWGVEFIELATVMRGISLSVETSNDISAVRQYWKKYDFGNSYFIMSAETRYIVVANGFKVLQNALDIFDSVLVYFSEDRPIEEYGVVLAHS